MTTQTAASGSRRLVFVQFGDYAEAVHRFEAGGAETYYGQKYSVDHVAGLVARLDAVTVVNCSRSVPFEKLSSGVGASGVELYPRGQRARHAELISAVEALDPTDLIIGAPLHRLIRWALRRGIRVLPILADSFHRPGWRARIHEFLLRRALNDSRIAWVANHNIAASLDLARIGVAPSKILPYDWPALVSPAQYAPKTAPTGTPFRLLYVGQVSEAKGVGDAIRGLSRLPRGGEGISLTIFGDGPEEATLKTLPAALGVGDRVVFGGKVPHERVISEMRDHDVVIVPSRHEYQEGLPLVIYVALCTRTPVVVSDHPMFLKRIVPGRNGIVFRASDPVAFAEAIQRLRADLNLYAQLSERAGEAADTYLCPLKWHILVDRWLEGTVEATAWLDSFSLARRSYD